MFNSEFNRDVPEFSAAVLHAPTMELDSEAARSIGSRKTATHLHASHKSPGAIPFESVFVQISHDMNSVVAGAIDVAVEQAHVKLCKAIGLYACAILRPDPVSDGLTQSFAWTASPDSSGAFNPAQDLLAAINQLQAGKPVRLTRADGNLGFSTPDNCDCVVIYPIVLGNTVQGASAFGFNSARHTLAGPLDAQLRAVVDLVANVLARATAQREAAQLRSDIQHLRDQMRPESFPPPREINSNGRYENIIGKSEAIARVIAQVEQVAATESIVLLTGETGTGKELFAQLVHDLSPRNAKRMVKVNCAALPPGLVESELFGRERGAYTGALTREIGRFELAHQSTIFLDELGELPIELQSKLLRVLQDGQFERVGNPKSIHVNTRVIAATNRDLKAEVTSGRFREDLYYRLNVFPIEIPPLREHPEDIPMLAWAFAAEFGRAMNKTIETIPQASMEALQRYPWPGNVRELRNIIERAVIVTNGPALKVVLPQGPAAPSSRTTSMNLHELERQHILDVLRQSRWRVRGAAGAAEILGLKPTTLEARMAKLGISRNSAQGQ